MAHLPKYINYQGPSSVNERNGPASQSAKEILIKEIFQWWSMLGESKGCLVKWVATYPKRIVERNIRNFPKRSRRKLEKELKSHWCIQ